MNERNEQIVSMVEAGYSMEEATEVVLQAKPVEGNRIYVNIGVPFSCIPIMQKVLIYVEPTTDTPITAAKKLRKQVADNIENHGWVRGTFFKPAELYYEIYGDPNNTIPFAASANSPKMKDKRYSIVEGS